MSRLICSHLRTIAFAAACAVVALPAYSAPAPVAVEGTTWTVSGTGKLSVARLGKDRDPTASNVSFLPGNRFEAIDYLGHRMAGPYSTSGRRGNKLSASPDAASLQTAEGWIADWIEVLLDDEGLTSDVDADITQPKLKATVNGRGDRLKVKVLFKFRAYADDIGESSRGKYKLTLTGGRR